MARGGRLLSQFAAAHGSTVSPGDRSRAAGRRLLTIVLLACGAAVTSAPASAADFQEMRIAVAGGVEMLYAISVPKDLSPRDPRPLVLALHSGGERMRFYGEAYSRLLVAPALDHLRPIIIAPDCPSQSWADPLAERSVLALIEQVRREQPVDARRVLVTGFSLGGRGTWFMASHHPEIFTAAIPMAAPLGDEPVAALATMPTYIIHSRQDQVVAFAPAEQNARALQKLGRPVMFEALDGLGHFQMGGYVDALGRAGRWIAERWKRAGAADR
jgi:predicted peptidase